VDNEYILHNSIVLAIGMPKLSNLVEIWRSSDKKKLGHFWPTLWIRGTSQQFNT